MKQKWIATADSFADALVELCAKHGEIVLLDASPDGDTLSEYFCGILQEHYQHCSEENVMCVASELAYSGHVPFVFTRTDVVPLTPKRADGTDDFSANIKIVITDRRYPCKSPDAYGSEGIASAQLKPSAITIYPADATEARAALKASYEYCGTVYLQLSKQAVPIFHAESFPLEIGKGETVVYGNDVAIVANGIVTHKALEASTLLAEIGIRAMVINMATVHPLDKRLLIAAAKKCGKVIACEDSSAIGCLCETVAAALSEIYPSDVEYIGIRVNAEEAAEVTAPEKCLSGVAKHIAAMAIKMLKPA